MIISQVHVYIHLFVYKFCKLGIPVTTTWRDTCVAECYTPYPVYKNLLK